MWPNKKDLPKTMNSKFVTFLLISNLALMTMAFGIDKDFTGVIFRVLKTKYQRRHKLGHLALQTPSAANSGRNIKIWQENPNIRNSFRRGIHNFKAKKPEFTWQQMVRKMSF